MMHRSLVDHVFRWLPETGLLAALLFLALRDLGTFPAAWADDSLFMIVARSVAEGRGYALPILGQEWMHPYILAVGPTLIWPVALAIKFLGFSVAVARIPMVLTLLGTTLLAYRFTYVIADRVSALWTVALFVSFSAFINTGKPVLGEVPGFFSLLLGILFLQRSHTKIGSLLAGVCFGLAAITKISYALLFPALIIALLDAAVRRDAQDTRLLCFVLVGAALITIAGGYWLGAFTPGFYEEIRMMLFARSAVVPLDQFTAIALRPAEFLRLPYMHFVLVCGIVLCGWRSFRGRLRRPATAVIATTAFLFLAYFLNGPGWYRTLLPSTLILFLFVPTGARAIFGRTGSTLLLAVLVIAQGWWQFTGRGSSASTEAVEASSALIRNWGGTDLVILPPEVFVRLPENRHWLFLTEEIRNPLRQPDALRPLLANIRCIPVFRKVSHEDLAEKQGIYRIVSGRYVILNLPPDCLR